MKLDDGMLLHSRWFALLVPADKLPGGVRGEALADAADWRKLSWPEDAKFYRGQPTTITRPDDKGEPEDLVQFLTNSDTVTAYMRMSVFNWLQTHLDDPEFWVRAVDQPVAIKDNGVLVGAIGPARLKRPA